jgi:effector-binding domain-containing protein
MKSARIRSILGAVFISGAALFAAGFVALTSGAQPAYAETAAPDAQPKTPDTATPLPTPATPASPPAPASPPVSAAPDAAPPAAAPVTPETKAAPGAPSVPGVPDDATAQMLDIPARPVAFLRGKSDWENGFKSIVKSLDTIQAEVAKAGLKQGGKPIAVFTETDDNGFGYEAMVPLTEKPEGKDQLGSDVKLGSSPSGKAIKFQHRGAYDDIDSTYDLITAYLDEKGLEAQNLFIEEYLTDTKKSDDQGLQVDIYVFIK